MPYRLFSILFSEMMFELIGVVAVDVAGLNVARSKGRTVISSPASDAHETTFLTIIRGVFADVLTLRKLSLLDIAAGNYEFVNLIAGSPKATAKQNNGVVQHNLKKFPPKKQQRVFAIDINSMYSP